MALSCYSNWDEETEANLKWNIQPQMELLPPNPEFLLEVDSNNLLFSDNSHVDPFMDYCYSQELFNYNSSSSSSSLLPFISSPQENLYSLVSEIFPPVQEYYEQPNYHYNLKRQKVYEEESFINPGFLLPNPTTGLSQNLEILGPFPSFGNINNNVPSVCGNKTVEATKKGGSFSAQSIAARQRRRKITEKTQELGKLIPGGQKMNTAEMFSAAFKYIKFLQTQVRILETMASIHQESGDSFENEELESLVGSSLIQEKLYAAGKCLVPKKLVKYIANNHKIQPNFNENSSSDITKLV